jgi:TRAP-type C4-dicarboxylate transport system substrate-binding protein
MKRKFRLIALLFIFSLLSATLFACGGASSSENGRDGTETESGAGNEDKVYNFTLSTHDPATAPMTLFLEDWADQVNAATDGQVKIDVYPASTLVAANAITESVESGSIDLGWCFTTFFPGQFPLTEVTTLPMIGLEHPSQAAEALWDMYEYSEAMREELSDYKVLMMLGNPSNMIFTADKPVYTVEDIKGLQLRAPSGVPTALAEAWGAVPIFMSPADAYEALSKGIIDGAIFEYSGVTTVNMHEYLNYYTEINLYMGVFLVLMNTRQWESLPIDLREKMDSVSLRGASIAAGEVFYNDFSNSREIISDSGGTFITPTAEAFADFKVAADEYSGKWVTEKGTVDFDAQDYYEKALAAVKKYSGKYF